MLLSADPGVYLEHHKVWHPKENYYREHIQLSWGSGDRVGDTLSQKFSRIAILSYSTKGEACKSGDMLKAQFKLPLRLLSISILFAIVVLPIYISTNIVGRILLLCFVGNTVLYFK